jgi:hypothetical protein
MKITRTFRNDVSDEPVIHAEFSAQEILNIFRKTNEHTNYVCHSLYSYIKTKLAKKGNPLNRPDVRADMVAERFSYHNLAYYELASGADDYLTMSHQVMEWMQIQLGLDTDTIHPDLNDCEELFVMYFHGRHMTNHQGRIKILEKIAAKENVPNLKLVIFDISRRW